MGSYSRKNPGDTYNKRNAQRGEKKKHKGYVVEVKRGKRTEPTEELNGFKSNYKSQTVPAAEVSAAQTLNNSERLFSVLGGPGGRGLVRQGRSDHLSLTGEALRGRHTQAAPHKQMLVCLICYERLKSLIMAHCQDDGKSANVDVFDCFQMQRTLWMKRNINRMNTLCPAHT